MNSIIIRTDKKTISQPKSSKGIKAISMIVMLMVITGGCLLMLSHEWLAHQKVLSAANATSHSTMLMCWRYVLYGFIMLCWPTGIRYLGKQKRWSQESIDYLSKQRIVVFLFFVIIELFFVYNLVGHVFRLF